MDKDYVIGIDFGSDSVRAVVIDIKDGSTVGSDFCEYRRWMQKLYCDARKICFDSIRWIIWNHLKPASRGRKECRRECRKICSRNWS